MELDAGLPYLPACQPLACHPHPGFCLRPQKQRFTRFGPQGLDGTLVLCVVARSSSFSVFFFFFARDRTASGYQCDCYGLTVLLLGGPAVNSYVAFGGRVQREKNAGPGV